jgi:anti-sigma factor RsiW
MNCRKFEKSLEDYLEGGLDFAARFRMERHARQCIRCGREMAGAQELKQMAREIGRVRAPSDFEASVMNEIGKRRAREGFALIRRFWVYGVEWPSPRKLALVALSLTMIGIVAFHLIRIAFPGKAPVPALVSNNHSAPRPAEGSAANREAVVPEPAPVAEAAAGLTHVKKTADPQARATRRISAPEPEFAETEYVEHVLAGPDDLPITVRLPKKIRMHYGQTSEEYFIRNVSH